MNWWRSRKCTQLVRVSAKVAQNSCFRRCLQLECLFAPTTWEGRRHRSDWQLPPFPADPKPLTRCNEWPWATWTLTPPGDSTPFCGPRTSLQGPPPPGEVSQRASAAQGTRASRPLSWSTPRKLSCNAPIVSTGWRCDDPQSLQRFWQQLACRLSRRGNGWQLLSTEQKIHFKTSCRPAVARLWFSFFNLWKWRQYSVWMKSQAKEFAAMISIFRSV